MKRVICQQQIDEKLLIQYPALQDNVAMNLWKGLAKELMNGKITTLKCENSIDGRHKIQSLEVYAMSPEKYNQVMDGLNAIVHALPVEYRQFAESVISLLKDDGIK